MSNSSELLYTSAPKGLRSGSRGFCTVVMSECMPAGLVGPLESLSAYRHVDGDGVPPVNFMHLQMKVAGRPVNVLSRISEAPPDYTGRTNIIAHHVVVTTGDRAAGGPAAVLRQSGFAIEVWDGEVRKVPDPKAIPHVESPLRIAETWNQHVGDAGWAGVVASVFESRVPGPTLYLIYQPQQTGELLALVDEATCLLPDSKRWNATFSTYARDLPPGVQCRLRCLVAGSPEVSTIPPSAMTLDLATGIFKSSTGELSAPPPGPLVEAARTGKFEIVENATPAEIPTVSAQSDVSIPVDPLNSFEPNEPNYAVPPPLYEPPSATVAKPAKATVSTRNYVLPLIAAAFLLLCLIGAAAFFFLQADSDDLLAELNAAAGIENTPDAIVPAPVRQKPTVQPKPEPENNPDALEISRSETRATQVKKDEAKQLKSLERLAKKVLEGDAFLKDDGEKSMERLLDLVNDNLATITEQKRQLEQIALEPTEEELSAWVRAEDGIKQLEEIAEAKRKEIDALQQHKPLKELQGQRKRLIEQLRAWNEDGKAWEKEKSANQLELIQQVSNSDAVEQTIRMVRERANATLQKSLPSLLDQYGVQANEKDQRAKSIAKQLDASEKELAVDLQRRRNSHRMDIYFDGKVGRNDKRLRIKPRCVIAVSFDSLASVDRLRVDDGKPIPFIKSSDDVKLPGRFEGWITVMRDDSGFILDLNLVTIPPAIRDRYPLLQLLSRFIKQQEATFSSEKQLKKELEPHYENIRTRIDSKLNTAQKDSTNDDIEEYTRCKEAWKRLRHPPPPRELDALYLDRSKQTVEDLGSVEPIVIDVFLKSNQPDDSIGQKISEHIANLEALQENYRLIKENMGLFDLNGQLFFGNSTRKDFGQSSFETIETFELFFFPELVFGPPPRE